MIDLGFEGFRDLIRPKISKTRKCYFTYFIEVSISTGLRQIIKISFLQLTIVSTQKENPCKISFYKNYKCQCCTPTRIVRTHIPALCPSRIHSLRSFHFEPSQPFVLFLVETS